MSVKNADGSASIWSRVKPWPVSVPSGATPVVKGPCRQPELTREPLPSSSGFGNAIRGGPAWPASPWWMCVAVLAGDW